MVINDSFFPGCLPDGRTERRNRKRLSHDPLPSPHRRHRHRHQHRPTSKCACGRHILLIHLVHSGNDSPTFALEREKGGKMLADWIWIAPCLFLTPLTSHVLCVFFFLFSFRANISLTHISTNKTLPTLIQYDTSEERWHTYRGHTSKPGSPSWGPLHYVYFCLM